MSIIQAINDNNLRQIISIHNINDYNYDENPILLHAMQNNNNKIIILLLKKGANVDIQINGYVCSTLLEYILSSYRELIIIKYILKKSKYLTIRIKKPKIYFNFPNYVKIELIKLGYNLYTRHHIIKYSTEIMCYFNARKDIFDLYLQTLI